MRFDPSSVERATAALDIRTIRDAKDQIDLRYGVQHPPHGVAAKRWLVFANGRTEWLEKYAYLAKDLQLPSDCGFLTFDHRGQGASGGARAYVDSYDTFASDAAIVVDAVVGKAPYALLSHSMGGLVALYGVLKGQLRPESLVLSSPLLGMPNEPLPRPMARSLATFMRAASLGTMASGAGGYTHIPFEANRLTHHSELYRRMQNTPYPVPGATFSWIAATFAAIETCFSPKELARLTVPTLVLGGTKEAVVEFEAFRRWVQAASSASGTEVQLKLVPGARHELFSEIALYYEQALAAVREWSKGVLR